MAHQETKRLRSVLKRCLKKREYLSRLLANNPSLEGSSLAVNMRAQSAELQEGIKRIARRLANK